MLLLIATRKPVTYLSEAESSLREQPVYEAVARLVEPWLSSQPPS